MTDDEARKTDDEARKLAEEHWKYTEQIILNLLNLTHYLYVESIIHGDKHGYERGRRDGQSKL